MVSKLSLVAGHKIVEYIKIAYGYNHTPVVGGKDILDDESTGVKIILPSLSTHWRQVTGVD